MKKSKIVLISVVLGLSLGSAVQLGMFNAIGNETLSFFHGILPDNVGATLDSSGAGNTNGLPSSHYQGAKKLSFDTNAQQALLEANFSSLDGGFTTTHQVSLGVPADTYFDFESGIAQTSSFTTADFFWDASGNTMTIDPANGALVKSVGIVPFNSVDAGMYQSTKLQKNRIKGDPPTWKVASGTVLLWQTAEDSAIKMRIDNFGSTLLITYSSIYYYSVDGNQDFLAKATANGWPGDGSASNPIVIQGLSLSSSAFGAFTISNTNLHFVMQNNNFNGLGANVPGVIFDNVSNGVVSGNTVSGYSVGVFVTGQSSNFSFSDNTISSNSAEGFLVEASSSVSFSGNKVSSNGGTGLLAYQSTGVTVDSNNFDSNSVIVSTDPSVISAGVNFAYTTGSVSDNNVSNGYGYGVLVFGDTGLTVSSNHVLYNGLDGISVLGSDSTTLSKNAVDSNSGNGISVVSSTYTVLANNNVNNNGLDGIHWVDSWYGTIDSNTASANSNVALLNAKTGSIAQTALYSSMWMDPSFYNTITNNVFSNSGTGVQLEGSDFNTFIGNTISNNAFNGFSIIDSSSNVISSNTLTGNSNSTTLTSMMAYLKPGSIDQTALYSSMWMDPSENNTVTNNLITNNYGAGIKISEVNDSTFDSNTVTDNGFNSFIVLNSSSNTITNNDLSGSFNPALNTQYMAAFKPTGLTQTALYSSMWMDPSTNNLVAHNTFDSNYGYGIVVQSSNNNYFTSNQITNNAYNGIRVLDSNGNNINDNTFTGNGNPLLRAEMLANSKPGSITQTALYSAMFMDPSTHNNVFNNIINNNYGHGIEVQSSDYNSFSGNTITSNAGSGVFVVDSSYNTITNNDLVSNSNVTLQAQVLLNLKSGSFTQTALYSSMWMDPSTGNYVAGNTITNSPGNGIDVQSSNNNVFDQNTVTNTGMNGFNIVDSSYNNFTYNFVTYSGSTTLLDNFLAYGKPDSFTQAALYSSMWMDPSTGNIIANNNLSNANGFGLQVQSSTGNAIYSNDMSYNSMYGYYSVNSNSNKLQDNSFTFNGNYGTYFDSQSTNSDIGHNDFVSNNAGSGHTQGYDNGGNKYADNFLIDANPNTAYTFDGSAGSKDATPSTNPFTDLSKYDFPPLPIDFALTATSLNLDQSGNYMDAHAYFQDGYSAYLINTTSLLAEFNGNYFPMVSVNVQNINDLHVKFDRMALVAAVYDYLISNGLTSATITINFYGNFNGGFMMFYGSDTVNAFY